MSMMLSDKRATRGARMTELVGEAVEQDSTFWGDSVWNDESEDDSFAEAEEEIKPDEFDSDFDDSEEEEEEGSGDEDKRRINKPARSNKYKEPPQLTKPKRKVSEVVSSDKEGEENDSEDTPKKSKKRKVQDGLSEGGVFNPERAIRESTKSKSEFASIVRQQDIGKPRLKTVIRPVRSQFSQRELLEDALLTQVANEKWLRLQKLAEDEKIAADRPSKTPASHYIRFISKRGAQNTITFSDVDLMPSVFNLRSGGDRFEEEE